MSLFFRYFLNKMMVQKRSNFRILAHITVIFFWGEMLKMSQKLARAFLEQTVLMKCECANFMETYVLNSIKKKMKYVAYYFFE